MKLVGSRAQIFIDEFKSSAVINGNGTNKTAAGQKYFIMSKDKDSNLPLPSGMFFIAPKDDTNQITLLADDKLFAIHEDRFCKTNASFEFSMGSVDVSDDCDPGATIPDGVLTISGSLAGLFRYDDTSGDFDNVTDIVVNRFLDIVEDNGDGVYTLNERTDSQVYMLTLLNSGMDAGQTDNWLFCPIAITSMSMSLGNTDAQNKDLSFSKGEGQAIIYKVPHQE